MPEARPPLPDAGQLLDQLPCGLVLTNHAGTILQVNRTFCDWVGKSADELVGRRKLTELFTMGGRIFHQTHWMPMLQMQGSLSEVKLDVRHRDGHAVPMMLNSVRRHGPDGGGHDEIVFTLANERNKYERELLQARKRADELVLAEREAQAVVQIAQARLRQALNGGALFVWGVDATTRRRIFGDEVYRLLGYAEPRLVGTDDVLAGMPASERAAEQAALDAALAAEGVHFGWRYRLRGADGTLRIVAASGQSFFDDDGSLAQFVGLLQDITAAEALRASAEDRALLAEQMVGIVSHDLRNPLSAILIGAKLLAGAAPLAEDQRRRLLANVASSAQRAQRLTAELLDFTVARVGPGLTVTRAPVDLHVVVGQVVDELRLAFPGRPLVHVQVGEGHCTAAADRLAQLLGNLVGNAVTYGRDGTPVTITSTLEGRFAGIAVQNFGPPIAPELIDRVFEPMVRGGDLDSSVRSVGLGLFIVRAIAEAHDGTVEVVSNALDGTEFSFGFPREAGAPSIG